MDDIQEMNQSMKRIQGSDSERFVEALDQEIRSRGCDTILFRPTDTMIGPTAVW